MILFSVEEFLNYFLIFMRIISFLIVSPIFSLKGIPNLLRVGLSFILSYLLYMTLPQSSNIVLEWSLAYGILIFQEVLFGLALGYVVNLIFISIQMAGQMVDFQIGFSMATYYDPLTSSRVSLFGNMYYWMGIALFFAIDGHYYLIDALAQSFSLVPIGSLGLDGLNIQAVVRLFSGSFLIAFQIAVPILVIILLVDVIMGLVSRTVPQINILMLGLPLKVLVGVTVSIVLLPALASNMIDVIERMPYQINELLQFIPFIFLFAADEKTEDPTPKKMEDSRKKGQVAKSMDLNSAIILLLLVVLLASFGDFIFSNIYEYLYTSLENGLNISVTQGNIIPLLGHQVTHYIIISLPIMIGVLIVGVMANLFQIGFLKSTDPLKPDIKRLNPIEGFKKIFSKKSLFELSKNLLKMAIVGYISYSFIRDNLQDILSFTQISIQGAFPLFKGIIQSLMLRIGIIFIALGIIDYVYQRYDFKKNLRMTKHEIKEESKQMEGDPQIKSQRRQKQRQMAMGRMMKDVPEATVIITNPTHLAIAIKYDESTIGAPMVLAKGADYIATKIREVAKEEEIPIIENKPLARTLYQQVEIGQEIPMELYQAVAEILAIVYQMDKKSKFV